MVLLLRALGVAAACAALLAGCSPDKNWRETRSAEDKFAVALPGKPKQSTRTIKLAGADVPMSVTAAGAGATLFGVGVARLPADSVADDQKVEATLNRFRDAMLVNLGTTVFSVEAEPKAQVAEGAAAPRAALAIRAQRHPQADANKIPPGPAQLVAQFFLVGDRLYQVTAHGGEGELTPQVLDTFFTSFQLLP
jgi:hypothetical protein